jgi:hypothetical protein
VLGVVPDVDPVVAAPEPEPVLVDPDVEPLVSPLVLPLPPGPVLLLQATPTAMEARVAKERILDVARCMKTVLSL